MLTPVIQPWHQINLAQLVIGYLLPLLTLIGILFFLKHMYQKRQRSLKQLDNSPLRR